MWGWASETRGRAVLLVLHFGCFLLYTVYRTLYISCFTLIMCTARFSKNIASLIAFCDEEQAIVMEVRRSERGGERWRGEGGGRAELDECV